MSRDHELLRIAVDVVVLTVRERKLQVALIIRANEPFRGVPALPGGFLRQGEDIRDAVKRELFEETGLAGEKLHFEHLNMYGHPARDPRGRVVSAAYLTIMPDLPPPIAGSDASAAMWRPVVDVCGTLAFDHHEILADAVERTRERLEHTTLATAFCEPTFTIGDLRHVYEAVWGQWLDPRTFNRKVTNTPGFVEATGEERMPETGRPATLYRAGAAITLNPPIFRSTLS